MPLRTPRHTTRGTMNVVGACSAGREGREGEREGRPTSSPGLMDQSILQNLFTKHHVALFLLLFRSVVFIVPCESPPNEPTISSTHPNTQTLTPVIDVVPPPRSSLFLGSGFGSEPKTTEIQILRLRFVRSGCPSSVIPQSS